MLKLFYKFAPMKLKHKIQLTQKEKYIFDTLLNFRKQQNLPTIIRVAGGWVRDKIMGKQSNDIDLTLDDMKGQTFAQLISVYFTNKGSKIGTIIQNPELSKHLQTATLQIEDRSIDIVNLRKQVYTQFSRIPQVSMGTPIQDAQRRDLTINSLFYNIVTQQIQDYTGKGLQDLQNGIIRTPIQPCKSFCDDPLRIFRVIRFAGRYQFKMVQQIFKAIQNAKTIQSLKVKVSKERIGQQFLGMIKDPYPVYSMQLLNQNKLWNIIFDLGQNNDFPKQKLVQVGNLSISTLKNCVEIFNKFNLKTFSKFIKNKIDQKDKKQKEIYYTSQQLKINVYLSALTLIYSPYNVIKKKNKQSLVQYVLKQSVKLSNKQCKFAQSTNKSVYELIKLLSQNISLHKIIKWLINVKQKWEISFIIAYSGFPKQTQKLDHVFSLIQNNNYQEIYLLPALIDGTYITNTLKRKGENVKNILQNSRIWRILNPDKKYQQFLEILHKEIQFFSNPNSYA